MTTRYPEAFSLDRMQRLLDRLGNPHRRYLTLHVAGTKGKGSTCAFAASILKTAGYRVGLYTSPHLESLRERIQVDAEWISEEAFAEGMGQIEPVADRELTYFEVITACAFLFFAKAGVDVAVVEVGMGGRLDATNLVEPEVTAITPISRDHTAHLGDTLEKIAREKAGIIKPNIPVVVAPQEDSADQLLKEAARIQQAPLHRLKEEVGIDSIRVDPTGSHCSLRTPAGSYPGIRIPLLGRHQITNAATALRMVELLREHRSEIKVSSQSIREGLAQTIWPGRCQLLQRDPPILLDGAHNGASAYALRSTLEELFPRKRILLIFGTSVGKDLEAMANLLGPWAKRLIVTQAQHPRAESLERIAEMFRLRLAEAAPRPSGQRQRHPEPILTGSVADALHHAQSQAGPDDLILVTGSLFVVGEALQALRAPSVPPLAGLQVGHPPC